MVSGQGKTETRVLVEEYVEGGDLSMMVKQFSKVGIQLPFEKVREYLDGVCDVLAHMAGLPDPVYHRDLKPHNIIIHPQHGPVLIDFGLAKMVATGEDVSVTRGGSGTWTAPERDSGISGPFTDVYSLGKILYYLLTNESPAAILSEEKVQIITEAEHPKWLADLTLKAAWPEREKRIQTAQQFRILLNNEGKWPQDQEVMGADTGADEYTTWR
jgi:serine/threonine-protein kinase